LTTIALSGPTEDKKVKNKIVKMMPTTNIALSGPTCNQKGGAK
jgi:hypothetical protein